MGQRMLGMVRSKLLANLCEETWECFQSHQIVAHIQRPESVRAKLKRCGTCRTRNIHALWFEVKMFPAWLRSLFERSFARWHKKHILQFTVVQAVGRTLTEPGCPQPLHNYVQMPGTRHKCIELLLYCVLLSGSCAQPR